jgi:FKBP-type peptidyl-prolyl cis-trans isomerase (trigger factor)
VAAAQVRRDLVLDAVVEGNGLRATEAELDQRVGELAAARGVPAGELYGNLQKNNRLPELERAITEEKAFAWLLQQSTIDEVKS